MERWSDYVPEVLSRIKALISFFFLFTSTGTVVVFCVGEQWLMTTYLNHYHMATNICLEFGKVSDTLWSSFQSDDFSKVANGGWVRAGLAGR